MVRRVSFVVQLFVVQLAVGMLVVVVVVVKVVVNDVVKVVVKIAVKLMAGCVAGFVVGFHFALPYLAMLGGALYACALFSQLEKVVVKNVPARRVATRCL